MYVFMLRLVVQLDLRRGTRSTYLYELAQVLTKTAELALGVLCCFGICLGCGCHRTLSPVLTQSSARLKRTSVYLHDLVTTPTLLEFLKRNGSYFSPFNWRKRTALGYSGWQIRLFPVSTPTVRAKSWFGQQKFAWQKRVCVEFAGQIIYLH